MSVEVAPCSVAVGWMELGDISGWGGGGIGLFIWGVFGGAQENGKLLTGTQVGLGIKSKLIIGGFAVATAGYRV